MVSDACEMHMCFKRKKDILKETISTAVYGVCLKICGYMGYKQDQGPLSVPASEWHGMVHLWSTASQVRTIFKHSMKCYSSRAMCMVTGKSFSWDKTMPKTILTFNNTGLFLVPRGVLEHDLIYLCIHRPCALSCNLA